MGTPFPTPLFFLPLFYQRGKISHLDVGAIGHLSNEYTSFNFLWVSTRQVRLPCTSIPRSYTWSKNDNGRTKLTLRAVILRLSLNVTRGKQRQQQQKCVIFTTEMASTKGKKKMFKVTGSLLVQMLKICLNTQFHKKH